MIRLALFSALALAVEALRVALLARVPGHPDAALGMVALLALLRPVPVGAVVGFLIGVVRDLLYGQMIGLEAVPFTLVGWLAGSLRRTVYRESFMTQALVVFGGVIVRGIVIYILDGKGGPGGLAAYLVQVTLVSALGTALIVPLAWHFLRPWFARRENDEIKKIRSGRRTA